MRVLPFRARVWCARSLACLRVIRGPLLRGALHIGNEFEEISGLSDKSVPPSRDKESEGG